MEDKHNLYGGKACMKKFCTSLRGNTKNITDFEKKNITVNKRRSRCRSILYLWKINLKKIL